MAANVMENRHSNWTNDPARWSRQRISDLVDAERGRQNAQVYSSEEVYARELERIFGRCWLCLGHESQVANPGDYITTYMGEDSVIVTRQKDGQIGVFLNQCRHRGVKLCRGDYGNARAFVCSYHGWCYAMDGRLTGMPHEKTEGYYGEIDKSQWGLIRVPKVDTYKGLIFANWDDDAAPLLDHLGEATWYLDAVLDRHEGGTEVVALHKWRVRGNWKFGAEQHVSDFTHAACSHVSFKEAINPGASIARLIDAPAPMEYGLQYSSPALGHGAGWMTWPDDAMMIEAIPVQRPEIVEWLRGKGGDMQRERLGTSRADKMAVIHMNIFPNLTFNRGEGYMRFWQPRGPNECEVWSYVLVNKNDPPEIKAAWAAGCSEAFSAAGYLEQDDTENAMCASMGLRGWKSQQTRLSIGMGMGHAEPHKKNPDHADGFDGPGNISFVYSEEGLRGFYRRWSELMADEEEVA